MRWRTQKETRKRAIALPALTALIRQGQEGNVVCIPETSEGFVTGAVGAGTPSSDLPGSRGENLISITQFPLLAPPRALRIFKVNVKSNKPSGRSR